MVREFLFRLVTFAGDQNAIARPGAFQRLNNGVKTVNLALDLCPCMFRNSSFNLVKDRGRTLFTRIVRGDDHLVSSVGSDLSHQRTLPTITAATAAKDDDDLLGHSC